MDMEIECNGSVREVAEGTTIRHLLDSLEVDLRRIAVEVNRKVVPKTEYDGTVLKSEDVVNVVTFVGGG